jgi:hypothetical protein
MLEGLTPPHNRAIYCKVEQILATLEEEDKTILQAALDDSSAWKASSLANQLRLRGVNLADTTITKHRTQACACYRR